jgi:hypothetical protein
MWDFPDFCLMIFGAGDPANSFSVSGANPADPTGQTLLPHAEGFVAARHPLM